jgi:hypothetical protein
MALAGVVRAVKGRWPDEPAAGRRCGDSRAYMLRMPDSLPIDSGMAVSDGLSRIFLHEGEAGMAGRRGRAGMAQADAHCQWSIANKQSMARTRAVHRSAACTQRLRRAARTQSSGKPLASEGVKCASRARRQPRVPRARDTTACLHGTGTRRESHAWRGGEACGLLKQTSALRGTHSPRMQFVACFEMQMYGARLSSPER